MEEKLELKVEGRSRRPSRDRYRHHRYSSRPSFAPQLRGRPEPPCPPLDVRLEPREQTVAQGSPALLQCSVSAPGPAQTFSYFWEKVRDEISEERSEIVGSQLRLSSVQVSDRGLYVCLVTSACGSRARSSSILEVEQREHPSLELYPATLQTVSSGDSVLFQCR